MSLSIRTNIASLTAQNNLTNTQTALNSSMARLSSGYRITSAGDDAAGLGISTKLEAQISSFSQATRNANDGLSVIQTTESALNETSNILSRLRQLAMQSASDGIGATERGYITTESNQLGERSGPHLQGDPVQRRAAARRHRRHAQLPGGCERHCQRPNRLHHHGRAPASPWASPASTCRPTSTHRPRSPPSTPPSQRLQRPRPLGAVGNRFQTP